MVARVAHERAAEGVQDAAALVGVGAGLTSFALPETEVPDDKYDDEDEGEHNADANADAGLSIDA